MFNEQLNKINYELEKISQKQKEVNVFSKEYQELLSKEIELLKQKKGLITDGYYGTIEEIKIYEKVSNQNIKKKNNIDIEKLKQIEINVERNIFKWLDLLSELSFYEVRKLDLGETNVFNINGKEFTIPTNTYVIAVELSEEINVYEISTKITDSIRKFFIKQIDTLLKNHPLKGKIQDFHKSIKIVFDGGILIIKDNDNEQFKVCFKSGVGLVL
ncbi:hypothetical protein [Anoxybacillus flavithermus]|uniref:Uncharacterized protein n=1 Tax=Anoxybacillus flavithermus TaxID=33934 RepID=A0A178TA12_9BACL|nr:hypothetical protein [Anoxybacillus flavithermus]OAO78548.1 hypothetical protein TAF16_1815 [Anoxybacillus flavithermus]